MKKNFVKPAFEMVRFGNSIFATSTGCGCFDAEWCPSDYTDCTDDGAVCECEINYNPALGNCKPCKSN